MAQVNEMMQRMAQQVAAARQRAIEDARQRIADEQRRRAEEAARQQAEAAARQAAEQAEAQRQEALRQTQLRQAQQQQEQTARERAALAMADAVNNDRVYNQAYQADGPLQRMNAARDRLAAQGRVDDHLEDVMQQQRAQIRANNAPRWSTRTLEDYQAQWKKEHPEIEDNRRKAAEEAARLAVQQRREASQQALGTIERTQDQHSKAETVADEQDTEIMEVRQDTLKKAKEAAMRLGYAEDEIPDSLEELLKDDRIALDPNVANNVQYMDTLGNWRQDVADTMAEQETTIEQARGDLLPEDAANYEKYRSMKRGPVFNLLAADRDELKDQKNQIKMGMMIGGWNDVQKDYGKQTVDEIDRRLQILADPKKARDEIDQEIAFYEGLQGSYWDDQSTETGSRLKELRAQQALIDAAAVRDEPDYLRTVKAGQDKWLENAGTGDRKLIRENQGWEGAEGFVDTTILMEVPWERRSETGNKLLYMTPKEREVYFYYLGKGEDQKAADYLEAMSTETSERRAETREQSYTLEAEKVPVLSDIGSMGMELAKPLTAVGTLVNNVILGNEYKTDSDLNAPDVYQQVVRNRRKEQLRGWADGKGINPDIVSTAYDVVMQVGDNLARAYGTRTMGVTNPALTTGAMSLGAAGSTTRQLLDEGVDPNRAAMVGGIAGLAEYITEKWSDAEWFKGMGEGFTGIKNLLKSTLQSTVMEASTEVASDLIQLAGEAAVLGDDNSYQKLINEYYYATGDVEEARKLAFEDQLGQEMYTFMLSGLSGGLMESTNRLISTDWKKYRENKKAEVTGGGTTEADQAVGSFNSAEAAAAAAETAADQTGDQELEEALAAAAAPMTNEEQRTETDAAEAEAVQAQGEPVLRRDAELENDGRREALAMQMAADQMAETDEQAPAQQPQGEPVLRRDAVLQNDGRQEALAAPEPAADDNSVAARAARMEGAGDALKTLATRDSTRTILAAWGLDDPDIELDDDTAAKEAWLAGIKGNMHNNNADGIHDNNEWHQIAGAVYDEIMDQYGPALADRRNGARFDRQAGTATLMINGQLDNFSRVNDPNMADLQPVELTAIAAAVKEDYLRRQTTKTRAARQAANKYDFKYAAWDSDGQGKGDGVTLKTVDGELTNSQVTQLRMLNQFNKNLKAQGLPGIDVNVYDTLSENGIRLNGSYKNNGGATDGAIINLALDAEGDNLLRAASHEMFHMIENWGGTWAGKIKNYVLGELEKIQGYDLEARRGEIRESYGEDADVDSEIVADSMFDVLNNEELVTQVLADNRTLGQKIADFAKKIWNAMKQAGQRIANMGSKEAQALNDQVEVLDEIRTMWEQGVQQSQRNIQAARIAENAQGYDVNAVTTATNTQQRTSALNNIAQQIVTRTQNQAAEMTDAADRVKTAVTNFAKGSKSLNAALEDQGLQPITGENDRAVAAWLGRELTARPSERAEIQVGDRLQASRAIYDDEGNAYDTSMGPNYDVVAAMRKAKAKVGQWQHNIDALTERLTYNNKAPKKTIKTMLTNLYTAMDNAYMKNSGFKNILPYAKRITALIARNSDWSTAPDTDVTEFEQEVFRRLKGSVVAMSEVLQPKQRQWKKDGSYYRRTQYDWGDISTYGSSVAELNRNYNGVLKFVLESKNGTRGVPPSTLLEEDNDLAVLVGYKSDGDNGNEANLLGRILDWVDDYQRRAGEAENFYSNQVSNEAEDLIMNYYDDQNSPETQEAIRTMQSYRGIRENQQKQIAEELDILKQLTTVQGEVINELGKQNWQYGKAKEFAEARYNRLQETYNRNKLRVQIEKELNRMRQWLFEPTKQDGKHVSDQFRGALAMALEMVNTRGRSADSYRTINYQNILAAVQNEFGTIEDVDAAIQGELIDPDLIPMLKDLEATATGKPMMEMTSEELQTLYKSLASITNLCRNVDNARVAGIQKRISAMSEDLISGLQEKDSAKLKPGKIQNAEDFLTYSMMDPQRYFEKLGRLGGETGQTIWQILRKGGLDTQIRLMEEAKAQMEKAIGKYNYKDWASGKNQRVTTFDLASGEQITLTDAAIMDLYLLNKRQQGQQHIYGMKGKGGGIGIARTQVGTKILKDDYPVKVTTDDVKMITSALSQEQIECAEAMMRVINDWGSKLGNETSQMLYGYSKFTEGNYWPIRTMQDQHGVKGTDPEQAAKQESLYAVLNLGFTKELNKNANNPVELGNAFDKALDHIAQMITYRSWAAPLMDVTRIMNYKSENGIVLREMNRVMGKAGADYLTQLLKNINGMATDKVEQKTAAFTRMFRNFKAAAVGWNLSTIAKQGLSIVRAFDVIPSHYFITGRQLTERFKKDGEARKVDSLMEKYAPIYSWKQDGRFTMDTGKDLKSIMLPKTETFANKFTELGMKGAGAADDMTWRSIWLAAENMIAKTTDLTQGSEEFYKAVGEKFVECIDKTQVVDSILHRTEVMRSNSMYIKMGTSFMGEPLKTWNMMANAIRAVRENPTAVNKAKLARTSVIMLSSAALMATASSIISALRHWSDDEPLEDTFKRYLLGEYDEEKGWWTNAIEFLFGNNLAGELNPINYIPFARDLSDIIQGHEVTRDDMQMLTALSKKVKALIDDTGYSSTPKKIGELAGAIADLFGIPTSNILKEIGYVTNWTARALENAGLNTLGVQFVQLMYDKQMGKASNMTVYAQFMKKLEDARDAGKVEPEFVERVREQLNANYDPEKLEKKIAKIQMGDYSDEDRPAEYYQALDQAIKEGDKEAEENIRGALARMGTTDKAINEGLRKLRMAEYTEGTTVDEYFDEYVTRVVSGDKDAAGNISTILGETYDATKMDQYTREALARNGEIIAAAAARNNGNLQTYQKTVDKFTRLGFNRDSVIKAVNSAINKLKDKSGTKQPAETKESEFGSSYGYTYSDLTSAIQNGSSYKEILEDLRAQGKQDSYIKSAVTSAMKPIYKELYNSNNPADRQKAAEMEQLLLNMGIGYNIKTIRKWAR